MYQNGLSECVCGANVRKSYQHEKDEIRYDLIVLFPNDGSPPVETVFNNDWNDFKTSSITRHTALFRPAE